MVGAGTKLKVNSHPYWNKNDVITVAYVYPFESNPSIEIEEDNGHGYGMLTMSDITKGHVSILEENE